MCGGLWWSRLSVVSQVENTCRILDTSQKRLAPVGNATGRVVYKDKLQFTSGSSTLLLNKLVPGLYLIQIIDSKGERFVIKFTIK